jgi:RNA polymerase sigma factor (sigma-70 family)
MTEKTEEEVKKAYGFARTMGRRFMQTHPRPVNHLDEDDYTQEAIIAWLEKKHIPYRLVDLYRKESPMGRRDWINKKHLTLYDPANIDEVANMLEAEIDVEQDVEKKLKLEAIQDVVNNMIDPRQQMIIIYKYAYDKSLTEIAQSLKLSKSYTSKLHQEALSLIKEEVKEKWKLA